MELFGFGRPNVKKMSDARDIKGLIKALGYQKDGDVKNKAAVALQQIGTPAVELLIAALMHENSTVRYYATKVLGKIGDTRAVEPLISALGDADASGVIAEALGRIGDTRAVEPLIRALGNANALSVIAEALGQIGDARAIEPLLSGLHRDDNFYVRKKVANSLKKLGWSPSQDETGAIYYVGLDEWDKCIEMGALAVEPLTLALHDSGRRWKIVDVLEKIGDTSDAEPLLIAKLDDPKLKDHERDEYTAVVIVLGNMGNTRVIEPLISLLKEPRKIVNYYVDDHKNSAARALGRIGEPAVEPLIAVIQDANTDHYVIRYAFSEIGAPAVEPLIAALQHQDKKVRIAAADALGRIGDTRAVEPLIAALGNSDFYTMADALGEIGDTRAIEPFITMLMDSDRAVRSAAANGLEKLGWQPSRDEIGARYWIALGKWKNCLQVDAVAKELLIELLNVELKVRPAGEDVQVEIPDPTYFGSHYDGVRLETEYRPNPDYIMIQEVLLELNES